MFTYILQPYSGNKSRFVCPQCGKKQVFSRYIHKDTLEFLSPLVGRCNRLLHCGYHYKPIDYMNDNGRAMEKLTQIIPKRPAPAKPFSNIAPELLKKSMIEAPNYFLEFLSAHFPKEKISDLKREYYIGSSKLWPGATVFWQMDSFGRIRTGKIMLYDPATGKRVKKPFNHISWVHKQLKLKDFELGQCMFGEHLLQRYPRKIIGLVESEKTALIASLYMPGYLWLALGGLQNLNERVLKIVYGREVVLFPDINGYETWKNKLDQLMAPQDVQLHPGFEQIATFNSRQQGLDLADYLLRFSPEAFINPPAMDTLPVQDVQNTEPSVRERFPMIPTGYQKPKPKTNTDFEFYTRALELIEFFENAIIPKGPIKPNSYTTILDTEHYIMSHLQFAQTYGNTPVGRVYLDHLSTLKIFIEKLKD